MLGIATRVADVPRSSHRKKDLQRVRTAGSNPTRHPFGAVVSLVPVTRSDQGVAHGPPLAAAFPFGVAPAAFVLFFLASEAARAYGIPLGFCIAQYALGIRCPGCGVTRSVAALLHGDVTGAIEVNAAGPVVCAFVIVHIVCFASAVFRLHEQHVLLRWRQHSERVLLVSLSIAWLWHSVVA